MDGRTRTLPLWAACTLVVAALWGPSVAAHAALARPVTAPPSVRAASAASAALSEAARQSRDPWQARRASVVHPAFRSAAPTIDVNGTEAADTILVHQNADGSLTITTNGTAATYTADQVPDLVIWAKGGDDTVTADASVTVALLVSGGDGDDRITTGAGEDQVLGDAGNDAIVTGAGADSVDGGPGNDKLDGGPGDNNLFGGDGDDTISGGEGSDYVEGGAGDDSTTVAGGDDIVIGGDGNDNLMTAAGLDWVDGGSGNDVIDAGEGDDAVLAGDGKDRVLGGAGGDNADGGPGNDALDGGPDGDVLYGLDGNDSLIGGIGDDYLDGGPGGDLLNAGAGRDLLLGGIGADRLVGGADVDLLAGGHHTDFYDGGPGADLTYAQRSDRKPMRSAGAVTWVDLSTTDIAGHEPGSSLETSADATFVQRFACDIETLRSVPPGRQLLTALDDAGHVTTVVQSWLGNSVSFDDWDPVFLVGGAGSAVPGAGSSSGVYYCPSKMMLYDGALPWERRPPIVGLWHELVHAWNAATGTCQPGFDAAGTRILELQCLGLPMPANALLWDNDNDPATPPTAANPSPFSENAWRAFLGLPARTQY